MFQDSIDFNEYTFGERKESLISAWRPLTVKLGSALLRGFQYLIFLTAGVMAIVNGISTAEGELNSGAITKEAFATRIEDLRAAVTPDSLRIIGIWILVILAVSFVASFILLRFFYKLDEEKHREIVAELEVRHQHDKVDPVDEENVKVVEEEPVVENEELPKE
jgi:Na+/melibiose symporter-like transporter